MVVQQRCPWCAGDALDQNYHDTEWGVPVHDDRTLFQFLILEGAQAGLSWRTILHKRENYRRAFCQFDPVQVAQFDARQQARLLQDTGIVRNRLKVASTISNAQAFLKVQHEHGSFAAFLWQFVEHQPIVNRWSSPAQVPTTSAQSDALAKSLRQLGFRFVGSTICYAYMQAMGLVNDHLIHCYRHSECRGHMQ